MVKENFYDSEELQVIESLPNGHKYSNILLKMYLKSLKFGGKLMVNKRIPYELHMLAAVVKHDIDVVRTAVELFQKFGLINIISSGEIFMVDLQKYVGKSSSEADRKRWKRLEGKGKEELIHNKEELIHNDLDKCPQNVQQSSTITYNIQHKMHKVKRRKFFLS